MFWTNFWSAFTTIGTLALAIATFVTPRENTKLTRQAQQPRVSVSGIVEFIERSEVDESREPTVSVAEDGHRVHSSPSKTVVVSLIKLNVYNLSSFPIQLVKLSDAKKFEVYESCSKLVPPQSSTLVETNIKHNSSGPAELFFRYAGQEKEFYRLRFTLEPTESTNKLRVHHFGQELNRL